MAGPKLHARQGFLQALKSLPAKKEAHQIVKDEVHEQVSEFQAEMTKPEIEKLRKELRIGFNKVGS